jgi:hypothetical protein
MKQFKINILRQSLAASALACIFILAGLRNGNAQFQSEEVTNTSSQNIKAYKTLNFGDKADTVDQKFAEILGVPEKETDGDPNIVNMSETFWRSLFDTDAEYQPYKPPQRLNYDGSLSSQSDKFDSLVRFFGRVTVHALGNSAISLNCYELYDTVSRGGSLAVVEVSYTTFDLDKLVETFTQNYPNAKKENTSYKIENAIYPGVFLEFDRTYFSDINSDRRATLSIPTGKFTFTFTEPSKLSAEQLATWEALMTKDGKTSKIEEYFVSVKTSFWELAKDIESKKSSDSLSDLGWNNIGAANAIAIIYGNPSAVFASKRILDPLMNNYRKSIEAADQEQKDKLKKDSDSSSGF